MADFPTTSEILTAADAGGYDGAILIWELPRNQRNPDMADGVWYECKRTPAGADVRVALSKAGSVWLEASFRVRKVGEGTLDARVRECTFSGSLLNEVPAVVTPEDILSRLEVTLIIARVSARRSDVVTALSLESIDDIMRYAATEQWSRDALYEIAATQQSLFGPSDLALRAYRALVEQLPGGMGRGGSYLWRLRAALRDSRRRRAEGVHLSPRWHAHGPLPNSYS